MNLLTIEMPCVKTIDSVKIYIYFRDHNPPHFHAIYAEDEELIEIKSLKTYAGSIPKMQRKKVLKWASQSKVFLINKWQEFNPN